MADAQTLLSVIVGGTLTLVAGVIGPMALEHWKHKKEERRRRQEKLVELISAVYEHKYAFERAKSDELQTSVIKIATIVHVYFPELDGQFQNLQITATKYDTAYIGLSALAAESDENATTRREQQLKNVDQAYDAYFVSFNSMQSAITEYARRKLK